MACNMDTLAFIEHEFQFNKCQSTISFLNCQLKHPAHSPSKCAHIIQIVCQIWVDAGFGVKLHYVKTTRGL